MPDIFTDRDNLRMENARLRAAKYGCDGQWAIGLAIGAFGMFVLLYWLNGDLVI